MDRYPALRSRSGVRRQALHGCASCSAGKPGQAILACPSGHARCCRSASVHGRTPGLAADASASCLARREHTRRLMSAPSLRCSAQKTGENVKSKSYSNIKCAKPQRSYP
jgi:hypothetical protein